jgi:hypothetical protein
MRKLGTKICETCNTEFQQGYTVSQKKWETMRFCSFSCRRHSDEAKQKMSESTKNHPATKRGEEHHNWKGGIVSTHNKLRQSSAYRKWRDAVNERDKHECQECGIFCEKGNKVSHHLVDFADRPDLGYLVENGITLCRPCHARIHSEANKIKRDVMASKVLSMNIVHV